jgi:hypothetical protein
MNVATAVPVLYQPPSVVGVKKVRRNVRDLLSAIDAAAAASLGACRTEVLSTEDRQLGASEVLRLLG